MITFKQYLEEGRDAPLYHATDIMSALSIIRYGFEPRTVHLSKKTLGLVNDVDDFGIEKVARGVSLTRSLPFAKSWGAVIFEIDQRQLTQRYKVIPIQYFLGHRKGARGSIAMNMKSLW